MIIIPIGIDCGTADYLKRHNLRMFSLPFDWCLPYNGVSEIIKNNFVDFLPDDNSNISNKYKVVFIHNNFPEDNQKMNRRCRRFIDLLNNIEETFIFFKKGHAKHNHSEALNVNCEIKNDILDSEELYIFLKEQFPKLKFKIIIALNCEECFECDRHYTSSFKDIIIYNITTKNAILDINKFENIFTMIYNIDT